MSNGDDVLDNWEEIDEAGLNNRLEKLQADRKVEEQNKFTSVPATVNTINQTLSSLSSGSNSSLVRKQPMKLLQRNSTQDHDSSHSGSSSLASATSPLNSMAASFQPVMMVLHNSIDEYQSANYMQPVNAQTVKILRRPTQTSEQRNNDTRPRQPIKTLKQREQEYAEARLRILGSAKNPDDDLCPTKEVFNNSIGSSAMTINASTTTIASATTTPTKTNSNSRLQGGQLYNNQFYYQQQQQQQQQSLISPYYQQQPLLPAYNNRTLTMPLQHQQQQQQKQQHSPQSQLHQHHPQQQQYQQSWSPIVGGSVSSPILRQQQIHDNILRLPRGPDGSAGFQMRR